MQQAWLNDDPAPTHIVGQGRAPNGGAANDVLTLLRVAEGVRALVKGAAEVEGLTPAQAQTLRFVARTKTFFTSIGNLAAALGTTHVNAVKVADGLQRRGLLERRESPRDGRVTLLSLTPAGVAAIDRIDIWERTLAETLEELLPADREGLVRGLQRLTRSMHDQGVVVFAQPCRGCVHFSEHASPGAAEPHRCALLNGVLSERESLLDCPEHCPVAA